MTALSLTLSAADSIVIQYMPDGGAIYWCSPAVYHARFPGREATVCIVGAVEWRLCVYPAAHRPQEITA